MWRGCLGLGWPARRWGGAGLLVLGLLSWPGWVAAAPIAGLRRDGVVLVDPADFGQAGVTFDQSGPDITLTTPQHTLKLQLGSQNATLDGAGLRLSAKPQYAGPSVLVPFEDVTTALGLTLSAEVRPEWGNAARPVTLRAGTLLGFQPQNATGPLSESQLRVGRDLVVPVRLPLGATAYVAACEAAVKKRLGNPATVQFIRRNLGQVYTDGDLGYQGRVWVQGASLNFNCMGSLDAAARLLYVKVFGDGALK